MLMSAQGRGRWDVSQKPKLIRVPSVTKNRYPRNLSLKNEKGTGAEELPAIVSGMVTWDALVSYWAICFPVSV